MGVKRYFNQNRIDKTELCLVDQGDIALNIALAFELSGVIPACSR